MALRELDELEKLRIENKLLRKLTRPQPVREIVRTIALTQVWVLMYRDGAHYRLESIYATRDLAIAHLPKTKDGEPLEGLLLESYKVVCTMPDPDEDD